MEKKFSILTKSGVPLLNGITLCEVEEKVKLELSDVLKLDYLESGQALEGNFKLRINNSVYDDLVDSDKRGRFLVSVRRE